MTTWRKKTMMFSEESSQAVFDVGNVEHIELRKTRTQCPSCLHCMLRKIKQSFEILRAPYFRTSTLNSRGFNYGPNSRHQHHLKAKDPLRGCSKKESNVHIDMGSLDERSNLPRISACPRLVGRVCEISGPHVSS